MSELLTLPRMARRLGVTQAWLRDEAKAERVPCLMAGNRYLFDPEAVQAALVARAGSTAQRPDVACIGPCHSERPRPNGVPHD